MRIAVIGAGAMGSVFGARLQSPGVEVVLFDINEEHIQAVRARGLTLGDADGERLVTIAATARIAEVADVDLALLLVDSNATADVVPFLPNVLANEGVACTLQNGIGNVEALAAVLGPLRVVAGSTFNSAAFIAPGHVRHTNVGPTVIGMPDGSPPYRVRALPAQLPAAGFPTVASDNAMGHVWSKFVLNCAINPVSALTGLRPGEIARHPPTARLLERLLDEVLAVAAAKGIRLPEADPRSHVLDHAFERYNRPSMLQHVASGRRTEIEALNGALVREANTLGISVPYNDAIWAAVSGIDSRRARARHVASRRSGARGGGAATAGDARPQRAGRSIVSTPLPSWRRRGSMRSSCCRTRSAARPHAIARWHRSTAASPCPSSSARPPRTRPCDGPVRRVAPRGTSAGT